MTTKRIKDYDVVTAPEAGDLAIIDGDSGVRAIAPEDLFKAANEFEFLEGSDPSSPAANKIALYAKDNGSGTTKLYTKDSAGTVTDLHAAGSGVGGATGSTDNALIRADGTGGGTVQASTITVDDVGAITFPTMSAPSTPASGHSSVYVKSDGRLYVKDESGNERGLSCVGTHTVSFAAGTLFPASSNGCAAVAQAETSSNKINYKYLAFDKDSIEYAWAAIPSPKSYNASTIIYQVGWTHPATTTNFKTAWQGEVLAASDGDALDTAVGTAVQVNDTGGTTQTLYISPLSTAVTPSNTPAKGDLLMFRVSRKADDVTNDTMAVDAHLLFVRFLYVIDTATDD